MYLLFYLFWIIYNGQFTIEIGLIGLVVAGVMYAFICKFMGWNMKKDKKIAKMTGFALGYLGVLIWEILKANIATFHMIFTSKYEREPVIVTFKTDIKSKVLRVILANSITLTPGTITVSVEDDVFTVHALDKDFTEGIEQSVFVKLLEKAEKMEAANE